MSCPVIKDKAMPAALEQANAPVRATSQSAISRISKLSDNKTEFKSDNNVIIITKSSANSISVRNIENYAVKLYPKYMFQPPEGLLNEFENAGLTENQARIAASVVIKGFKDNPELLRDIWSRASWEIGANDEPQPISNTGIASQHTPMAEVAPAERPVRPVLRLPEGEIPHFKGKASQVYQFIIDTYKPSNSGEPLTLEFLRSHDMGAVNAFRSRRRSEPVPAELTVLTAEGKGSKMADRLADYGLDISTPEGKSEAVKLASTITKLVYGT